MPPLFIDERGKQNLKSIIFLHASGSSSQMWRHHVAVLEQDFHCILVDLPGHGVSRDIEWTNFDDVVEMIVAIINSKVHGKPHLVGLSLGGSLILKLLEKHSSLIDRVIVDGASPQPIKGYRKIIAIVYLMSFLKNTKFVANLLTKMMKEDGAPVQDVQHFVADFQSAERRSFRRAMSQANLLRLNLQFDNPNFFVSGGKEAETIHNWHRRLADKNARSECAYYPGKGHAWLFSDVDTHIQLLGYFFQDAAFPEKLKRF